VGSKKLIKLINLILSTTKPQSNEQAQRVAASTGASVDTVKKFNAGTNKNREGNLNK
jgi:hypothetical protein